MKQMILVVTESSSNITAQSFLGWFCLFVVPALIIALIHFGFRYKKPVNREAVENEEIFDYLFERKSKKNFRLS